MTHVECTEVNGLKVYSIGDEIIFIVGWNNPNNGDGVKASRGTIFIEKTCGVNDSVFWIKKRDSDPKSWDSWSGGNTDVTNGQGVNVDPTSGYVCDEVAVNAFAAIKWFLMVKSNSTPANRRAYEVYALNDGATTVDETVYAVLRTNTKPSGLAVSVDINTGKMRLIITGTENMDYSWVRIPVIDT